MSLGRKRYIDDRGRPSFAIIPPNTVPIKDLVLSHNRPWTVCQVGASRSLPWPDSQVSLSKLGHYLIFETLHTGTHLLD